MNKQLNPRHRYANKIVKVRTTPAPNWFSRIEWLDGNDKILATTEGIGRLHGTAPVRRAPLPGIPDDVDIRGWSVIEGVLSGTRRGDPLREHTYFFPVEQVL